MKWIRCAAHIFATDEMGGTLIEFGVTVSLLLLSIFSVMDCSRALYADHFVCDAATEAARYAMVRGATFSGTSCTTPATTACMATANNVTTFVQGIAPFGVSTSTSVLTVTTTWPGTTPTGSSCSSSGLYTSPGCVVKVNVKYSFGFVLPFMPKNTLVLASTSAYSIAQ